MASCKQRHACALYPELLSQRAWASPWDHASNNMLVPCIQNSFLSVCMFSATDLGHEPLQGEKGMGFTLATGKQHQFFSLGCAIHCLVCIFGLQEKGMGLARATDEQQRLRKALLDAEIDMQVDAERGMQRGVCVCFIASGCMLGEVNMQGGACNESLVGGYMQAKTMPLGAAALALWGRLQRWPMSYLFICPICGRQKCVTKRGHQFLCGCVY
eukprot:1162103-Pelagomonas_calceolata.AAC.6